MNMQNNKLWFMMKQEKLKNGALLNRVKNGSVLFCFFILMFLPLQNGYAQDNIALDAKFLDAKYANWGLQEVERKQETLSNVTIVRYHVFTSKDKNAEKRNYLAFSEGKLVPQEMDCPDSLKAVISIGFSSVLLSSKPAIFKVTQKDNICSVVDVFHDMVMGSNSTIWSGKLPENTALFVHDLSEISPIDSAYGITKSKWLYVIQNTDKNAVFNEGLGTPLLNDPLNKNGIPARLLQPLFTDIHFAAYSQMLKAGFSKDHIKIPNVFAGSKGVGLMIDSLHVDIGENRFFKSQVEFINIPFFKQNQVPAEWLNHELLKDKKESRFMLNKMAFPEVPTLDFSLLSKIPTSADSILKAELSAVFKSIGLDFSMVKCKFYTDANLNGLYVSGLNSEKLKPEWMYLPLFKKTIFVDFVPIGMVSDAQKKQIIDSARIFNYNLPVQLNRTELLYDVPEILDIKPDVTVELGDHFNKFEIDTKYQNPSKLIISYKSLESTSSKENEATDSLSIDSIFIYYLDIAELNNKRLLQYYLQEKIDSIITHKQQYLLFLSNGSNPIIASSNDGNYMELIKKISFLYPETASPKNDKSRMVESLLQLGMSSQNMVFNFFLSPVSYNRFKDYMINEVAVQYNANVNIIVEELGNQRIDSNFNHIELNAKKP